WLSPSRPPHLDSPRAGLRVICSPLPDPEQPGRSQLGVQFQLARPRTGEKLKTLTELIDLTNRAAHEQELFSPEDWEFIQWLAETHSTGADGQNTLILSELELLHW